MNNSKIILFTFISLLLSSCNKGGLVDEANSNSYFYSSDKSKILFKQLGGPDISRLWNYEWLEVPADPKTFRVMKGGFGKDAKNIFFGTEIIDYVDYNTFQRLDESHYIDHKNVYTQGLKIIKDANPKTFQIIKSMADYYGDVPTYKWAKDDKHYFYKDSIVDVDYNSFKFLTSSIMVDNNYFYGLSFGKFAKILNKNGTSEGFTVLSNDKVYNSKFLYYKHLENDENPFSEIPIKDINSIKKFGYGSYFTVDGIVYYEMMKIDNADPNSFVAYIKGWAGHFAKDKNHFYLRTKVVPNVNPKKVIYNPEKDEFSYRGKFWNYETEKFDKENSR